MDFSWTEEQLARKKETAAFAQALDVNLLERDQQSGFSHELWQACADFGIQALATPAEFGGQGQVDLLTALLIMEGLGYGCRDNGLTFALNAQMWTVQMPLAKFGSQEQKEKYLPGLTNGQLIGAHAITEPDSGSDIYDMATRADKHTDGYLLNGTKKFISLAPIADLALVFATVDPELGRWGITAFVVELNSPGVFRSSNQEKMGLRTVPLGEIRFEDCLVPEQNRVGPEGTGVSVSSSCLDYERCSILASQLGAMEYQLETSIAYARDREQRGQPIGKFQAISHRIADMKLRLETSRLLLYQTAWLKTQGKSAMMESALLKLHLAESFVQSSLDAIRVHGGNGYMSEFGIERDLRDAVGGTIYAGTSDIQRNIIARLLDL